MRSSQFIILLLHIHNKYNFLIHFSKENILMAKYVIKHKMYIDSSIFLYTFWVPHVDI